MRGKAHTLLSFELLTLMLPPTAAQPQAFVAHHTPRPLTVAIPLQVVHSQTQSFLVHLPSRQNTSAWTQHKNPCPILQLKKPPHCRTYSGWPLAGVRKEWFSIWRRPGSRCTCNVTCQSHLPECIKMTQSNRPKTRRSPPLVTSKRMLHPSMSLPLTHPSVHFKRLQHTSM